MRKSKFTESQIVATLKQVEGGRQVKDVCHLRSLREKRCGCARFGRWPSNLRALASACPTSRRASSCAVMVSWLPSY